jgi:HEAT repeat protein
MRPYRVMLLLAFSALLPAQNVRPKDVREIAKGGSSAIPQLQELLKNPDAGVRLEAVRQITEIGTAASLNALVPATRDNDPEVQIHATDGLVNFYLPGYVRTGIGGSLRRAGSSIKGRFTDTNDQAIESYVTVRPEVVDALGKLVSGGGNMDARANAARALGILRGRKAIPDLVEALHSKNSDAIYESLVALQKIRDESAGPRVTFLVHDLDPKVQIAAIETAGLLQAKDAVPELADALKRARDAKVKHAALTAIAMLPAESSRDLYAQYLQDKDDRMRAAAAEGYARLRNHEDLPVLEKAWQEEGRTSPRLSLAFAQVMLGRTGTGEFSPLQYLIDTLNSAAYKGEALPLLVELARDDAVRNALYGPLETGTRDEKIGLADVLARSGGPESIPHLQTLSHDKDTDVAREALRALRTLQARL